MTAGAGGGEPERDGEEAPRRGRAALTIAAMLLIGLAVPLVGIMLAWKSCTHTAMQGRVDVKSAELGTWRAPLARCVAVPGAYAPGSGEVELGRRDDNGPLVRFTMDPIDGAIVRFWPMSGDRTVEIRAKDCPGLKASLRRVTGENAASARYDGNVSGICPVSGGGTASIDVWFRSCGE